MSSRSSHRASSRPPLWILAALAVVVLAVVVYLVVDTPPEPNAVASVPEAPDASPVVAVPVDSPTEATTPAPAPATATTERARGEGAIHAFVTDRVGQPVAGAVVTVELREAEEGDDHGFPVSANTDEAGEARFTELPFGRYFVQAEGEKQAASDSSRLSAAHALWNVDLVLKPAASIEGKVVNAEGAPVSGAALSLLDVRVGKSKNGTAISGEDGHFALTSVPLGKYKLQTVAAGYAPALSEEVAIGGALVTVVLDQGGRVTGVVRQVANRALVPDVAIKMVADDFVELEFKAASDAKGEFVLENVPAGVLLISSDAITQAFSPPETMVKLAAGETVPVELLVDTSARVTGRVYDSTTNEPIAGAQVTARVPDSVSYSWISKPTDAEGRYELTGLTPGPIDVSMAQLPRIYGRGVSAYKEEIELQPGQLMENVDLSVDSGLMLCGVVVNEKDEPVAGAEVSMGRSADPDSGFEETSSDADGTFCFPNVPLGGGDVSPEGTEPAVVILEANSRGMRSDPVEVQDPAAEVRLKLLPLPKGVIAGVVVDDKGKPAMATVTLRHPYVDNTFDRRLGRTDVDGHFLFQDLAAGDFEIWTKADNGSGYVSGTKLALSLSLAAGQRVTDLRVVLTGAGAVTGVLKDATGAPLPHVSVEVWDLDKRDYVAGAFTDREGRFNITGLEGTNLEVRPRDDSTGGYWHIPVKPGDELDITLTPDMFGDERPPEPIYLIHPETGEEVVTTEEEMPALVQSWQKKEAE